MVIKSKAAGAAKVKKDVLVMLPVVGAGHMCVSINDPTDCVVLSVTAID